MDKQVEKTYTCTTGTPICNNLVSGLNMYCDNCANIINKYRKDNNVTDVPAGFTSFDVKDGLELVLELGKMFEFYRKPTYSNPDIERSILNLGTVSEASEILDTLIPAMETTTSFLNTVLLAMKAVKNSGFQADVWKKDLVLQLDIPVEQTIKECYDSIFYPIKLASVLGYDFLRLLKHGNHKNFEKYSKAGGYYAKNTTQN